jgi:hypothetical protein
LPSRSIGDVYWTDVWQTLRAMKYDGWLDNRKLSFCSPGFEYAGFDRADGGSRAGSAFVRFW